MSRDATPAGVVVDPATCAEAHLGHASRERSGSGRSTSRVAPRCAFVSACVVGPRCVQTRVQSLNPESPRRRSFMLTR